MEDIYTAKISLWESRWCEDKASLRQPLLNISALLAMFFQTTHMKEQQQKQQQFPLKYRTIYIIIPPTNQQQRSSLSPLTNLSFVP